MTIDRPTPPQHGDEADLFRRHHHAVERMVRAFVRAPDAVIEDACSFAWLQFLTHQPERDNVTAWVAKTAIREGWRLAARERRDCRVDLIAEDDDARHAPVDVELAIAARDALAAVAALPERQRRYLEMVLSGHSYLEVMSATGTSFTCLNKHLSRARKTLRHQRRR